MPASGLAFFPKTGHVLNLEEPALFNEMVERFIALVEAGRWPARDPQVDPGVERSAYFASSPARLSRNTPCSPNMFQNHHGTFSRSGRP